MRLKATQDSNIQFVYLEAKTLDAANSAEFKSAMAELIRENPRIILDVSATEFLDSSGCGALLTSFRQAAAGGGDLKLCAPQDTVSSLFDMLKLNQVIDVYNTKEEAKENFNT